MQDFPENTNRTFKFNCEVSATVWVKNVEGYGPRRLQNVINRYLQKIQKIKEQERELGMRTYLSIYLSTIYPIVLGTVGAPHDLATNIRHSPRFSALLTASFSSKPVQSRMLPSHRFLCLPPLLPSRTVPWRTVLASPEALVTCPYHFICVFLQWTRILRRVQWLSESCFAPLRW